MSTATATAAPQVAPPLFPDPPQPAPPRLVFEDCAVCDTIDATACPACNATGTIVLRVR